MVNLANRIKILTELGQILNLDDKQYIAKNKISNNIQSYVNISAKKTNLSIFFEVLVVIIKKK